MLRPQECRDKAIECYRMARRSRNSRAREVFKQMARYWRSVSLQAAAVEKMSKAGGPV
jgi:hypothetical protein